VRTPADGADEASYLRDLDEGAASALWRLAALWAGQLDEAEPALQRAWGLVDRWNAGAVRLAQDGDPEQAAALAFSAAELADTLSGAAVPFARAAARPLSAAELARWRDARRAAVPPGGRPPPLGVGYWRT
jgi:hypothetical protein